MSNRSFATLLTLVWLALALIGGEPGWRHAMVIANIYIAAALILAELEKRADAADSEGDGE